MPYRNDDPPRDQAADDFESWVTNRFDARARSSVLDRQALAVGRQLAR